MKNKIRRTFIPGSEWVYLKIYTGSNTADQILIKKVNHIIHQLEADAAIEKWFFIRYSDPDFHLRIRLLLNEQSKAGFVLPLISQKFQSMVDSNLVWKIQIDTYKREIERYKDFLMEATESLFYLDSKYMLKILRRLSSDEIRWQFSIKMIDSLLNDFGYTLEMKRGLMVSFDHAFKREFGFIENNPKQLNMLYRTYSKDIENIILDKNDQVEFLILRKLLSARSVEMAGIITEIRTKCYERKTDPPIFSYIHMMINRMFKSRNRAHELVIYSFLSRFYDSMLARTK